MRLGDELNSLEAKLLAPCLEIDKIDIRGEILLARTEINSHPVDSLMTKIGPRCSARSAAIDLSGGSAVIDRENRAAAKMPIKICQPVPVGLKCLDALTGRVLQGKR